MIKLEDNIMSKKQYCIPKVQTMPLFSAGAICVVSTPSAASNMDVKTGVETNEVW